MYYYVELVGGAKLTGLTGPPLSLYVHVQYSDVDHDDDGCKKANWIMDICNRKGESRHVFSFIHTHVNRVYVFIHCMDLVSDG